MFSVRSSVVLVLGLFLSPIVLGCATVPLAPPEADSSAKRAKPGVDTSLVYVYRTWAFRAGGVAFPVTANGTPLGGLNTNSYLYFRSYPGNVTISIGDTQRTIMVQAGQTYFLKFFIDWGNNQMVMVKPRDGRTDISSMQLVALPDIAIINIENRPTGQAWRPEAPPPAAPAELAVTTPAAIRPETSAPLAAAAPEPAPEPVDEFAAAFAVCEANGRSSCYRSFLEKCPDCEQRPKALEALAGLLAGKRTKKQNPLNAYGEFIKTYPDGMAYVPAEYQIFFNGPEGLTPYDLVRLRKEHISDRIIARKIMASDGPYKDFSLDEVRVLKKQGLSDDLIEAMLTVAAKSREKAAAEAAEQQQKEEEVRRLDAEKEQQRKAELAEYEQQRQEAIAACKAGCDDQRRECLAQVRNAKLGGGSLLERAFNLANTAMTAANCVDAVTCKAKCEQ